MQAPMKKILFLLLFPLSLFSQTNVRAWYAKGQVWVVWEVSNPLPETYAIYAKPTAFSNTANAVLLGRPFREEYLPGALREQLDSTLNYRVPNGQGGIYQLKSNEGLFVATPHQTGAIWVAVVKAGETTVNPGVNITQSATPYQYNPTTDRVQCHLQAVFPSPFSTGYNCLAYYMWADGRQNHWEGRPDFPIMANAVKNGMPSMFMISVPIGLDTSKPFPLSIWLHGGGGTARQSLAGSRKIVNIDPKEGILVAHNDDLFGYLHQYYGGFQTVTRHFGWRKNYDPFNTTPTIPPVDTVINYTQRRYLWIDDWLTRNFNVDPTRISINGHSMGSKGTTAMAKVFPEHYASATIFNNGFFFSGDSTLTDVVFGPAAYNYPTNLRNRKGEVVIFPKAFDMTDNLSPSRDFPVFRCFDGKNDTNSEMHWSPGVVAEYRAADSLGIGAQLFWSERTHDIGGAGDHWAYGNLPTEQTVLDDVAYEETHFRSDRSYPAFFNNRLDPTAADPGDGTIGTGANGVGDDWGTWGGWHHWDEAGVIDLPGGWSATAWLPSNAVFANDICPHESLTADVAIRKPQQFKPATGKTLHWVVKDAADGTVLQSGNTNVQADSLVVIPKVVVYKDIIRKVRIIVADRKPTTNPILLHIFHPCTFACVRLIFSMIPSRVSSFVA
jgi:hypothetical protein